MSGFFVCCSGVLFSSESNVHTCIEDGRKPEAIIVGVQLEREVEFRELEPLSKQNFL